MRYDITDILLNVALSSITPNPSVNHMTYVSYINIKGVIIFHMFFLLIKWKTKNTTLWLTWPLWNICITNDHGYVPLVVNTSRSFPHCWLISGFVTRLTRRVSLVEQELLTLPEHMRSTRVFSFICMFCWSFVLFLLAIALSVLLRYTDYDYS
jgi:hypothetical protein